MQEQQYCKCLSLESFNHSPIETLIVMRFGCIIPWKKLIIINYVEMAVFLKIHRSEVLNLRPCKCIKFSVSRSAFSEYKCHKKCNVQLRTINNDVIRCYIAQNVCDHAGHKLVRSLVSNMV